MHAKNCQTHWTRKKKPNTEKQHQTCSAVSNVLEMPHKHWQSIW